MPDPAAPVDYTAWVRPLQGTASQFNFSHGNCLPLVSRPFGMVAFTPQTDEGRWIFHSANRKLQGVRATHQPSPWIADYGHFTLMPQVGERFLGASARASVYRDEEMCVKPHYMQVFLRRYMTMMEMAATERCARFRFTFPKETGRIILEPFQGDSSLTIEPENGIVTGYTRANSGGVPDNYATYIVAVLDRPMTGHGLFQGKEVHEGETQRSGDRVGAYVEFPTEENSVVEMKVATSFISVEQAWRNLEREIGDNDYEAVKREGERVWNGMLGRFEIEGASEEQLATFTTCLYRALLFPHRWHEPDADGNPHHFSPYDGQLHPGVLYADNGFWDTHRTVYPFLSLFYPEEYQEIIRGWVQACKEGGWTPRWPSPGYRSCMISTHLDAVIADAFVKGFRDFDVEAAYQALRRDAFETGDAEENTGRKGIVEFDEMGYVPADKYHHSVSCTLDYAYNDYCIAEMAKALGHEEDVRHLRERATYYRNVYDPSVGFMRGRNADGSWREPFDEFEWGGPYVEGSAWQCSWAVPHDPAGLIALAGGPEAFAAVLDRMLALPPEFHVGSYGSEIHEMAEMAHAKFGQYAHSNQPVHHVLYLYSCAGQPWKAQYWVRRVLDELYGSGPDGFPGDEDNGEMSCWYLLSALGIFPLCPGHPTYVLGNPLFPKATVRLSNGQTLTVIGEGNSRENVYVQRVTRDGEPYRRTWIAHEDLMRGGELTFVMGAQPNETPSRPEDLPFSLSTEADGGAPDHGSAE
ncbi:MAG: GH92 family glycosyl hydrolase [Armatimonadetes bacterium]|nr:GH92 family glycosyl hydrolase [Armatimonadota bacterium]